VFHPVTDIGGLQLGKWIDIYHRIMYLLVLELAPRVKTGGN